MKKAAVTEFFERLAARIEAPTTELDYRNPFTLLVAVVLSAQATDKGVNKATKALFARGRDAGGDARPWRGAPQGAHQDHRPLQHEGQERDRAKPGAWWRNTAARCRANGRRSRRSPASAARPRTWCSTRSSASRPLRSTPTSSGSRTAAASHRAKTPRAVEDGLNRVVPARFKQHAHHWLILHGRYVCKARTPDCPACVVRDLCRYKGKTT